MTDRLTPPLLPAWALRDLAEIANNHGEWDTLYEKLMVEAARREAKPSETMEALATIQKHVDEKYPEGPGSAAAPSISGTGGNAGHFVGTTARREAEAKPQNGRGHIPLITCPGSTKSCMGYDCLDKGCLDGEPKTVHTCNFVDSDQVGVFICHGCGRKLMPKGLSVDALRSANISIGGCEVCTTPTGCKQEKHCDHFNMAFYSEREGLGSAATHDEFAHSLRSVVTVDYQWDQHALSIISRYERDRHNAADRIEAQAREIAELKLALEDATHGISATLTADELEAQRDRADRAETDKAELVAAIHSMFDDTYVPTGERPFTQVGRPTVLVDFDAALTLWNLVTKHKGGA